MFCFNRTFFTYLFSLFNRHIIPFFLSGFNFNICLTINIIPPAFSTDIDVICILPITKLFSHNILLEQIHLVFVLQLKKNRLYKLVKPVFLLSMLEIFAASEIIVIDIFSNMLADVDFTINSIRDLVDQIMSFLHFVLPLFYRRYSTNVLLLFTLKDPGSVGWNHESGNKVWTRWDLHPGPNRFSCGCPTTVPAFLSRRAAETPASTWRACPSSQLFVIRLQERTNFHRMQM